MPSTTNTAGTQIGDLVRRGAATRVINRRTVPSEELRALLRGTVYAQAPAPTEADQSRGRLDAFLTEARGDARLRRQAREQGIDVEELADALEREDRGDD